MLSINLINRMAASSGYRSCLFSLNTRKTNLNFKNNLNLLKFRFSRRSLFQNRNCSSNTVGNEDSWPKVDVIDRDPGQLFIDSRVQTILKRVTGFDLNKIFKYTSKPANKENPHYQFMTETHLKKAMEEARLKAREKLQMPPVLKERQPIDEIISYDPELKGLLRHKLIFTDISIGVRDKNRVIVIRDIDGTLRKANWNERDRMLLTFFPIERQKYFTPRVFIDQNMTAAFDEGKYKFVLDLACLQYEPDHPSFINICRQAYEHIYTTNNYDILHSTRHFGPMVFYFAFNKKVDHLLQHLIQKDRIEDGADVVRLYHLLNPDCKSANLVNDNTDSLAVMKMFTQNDAETRSHLELALQTYEELAKQKQLYNDDVKKAHGHNI